MKNQLLTSILTVFFTMSFFFANAQSFGVKAGYNLSTITYADQTPSEAFKLHHQPGFHIGLNFGYDFSDKLSIETLLSLNSKGIQSKTDFTETSTRFYYLDLPVTLKYKVPVGDFNLFASGGGYIGTGLYGKYSAETKIIAIETSPYSTPIPERSRTLFFDSKEKPTSLKRFDAGIVYGLGIEYKLFSISAQHLVGMTDLYKSSSNHHRVFQISLGYTFRNQAGFAYNRDAF